MKPRFVPCGEYFLPEVRELLETQGLRTNTIFSRPLVEISTRFEASPMCPQSSHTLWSKHSNWARVVLWRMTALLALGVSNAVAYTAPSGVCAPGKASYSSQVSMSNSWGAHRLTANASAYALNTHFHTPRERESYARIPHPSARIILTSCRVARPQRSPCSGGLPVRAVVPAVVLLPASHTRVRWDTHHPAWAG